MRSLEKRTYGGVHTGEHAFTAPVRKVVRAVALYMTLTAAASSVAAAPRGGRDAPSVTGQSDVTEPVRQLAKETGMTGTATTRPPNRLSRATSPYLLQHAHNPVDWWEWCPEALAHAAAQDKPIFLSIGYSACHWCHVMAHESFESEEIAALLNAHFVSIKVDREERPDLDELYMAYTQASTGHGGWPMSVWLTPDGTPFYAGTYYTPAQLSAILTELARLWQEDRGQLTARKDDVRNFYERWAAEANTNTGSTTISRELIDLTAENLVQYFDPKLGGISSQGNKFPPSMTLELFLRVHRRTDNPDLLQAVKVTLDHMARGGIYDHLGGGICRYSTDPEWLVPHFEKMLYDQAQVSSIYLDAYQYTRKQDYADVARDIFAYVLTDLQAPEGGFYSSRDADSEGLEGAYYIWTRAEIEALLGPEEAELFCTVYGVTEQGNWFERLGHAPSGPKNILHLPLPLATYAEKHNLDLEKLRPRLAVARTRLLAARARRVPPGLDDKILTAWNGLMIASLAKGAQVLNEPKYAAEAARAADFILANLRRDGRLLRTYRAGDARLTAYLDDYAFFIEGLLNLYEATFERRWLDEAVALNEVLTRHYYDLRDGAYFFTANDAERLITRSKSPQDNALPSGNSVQALNLLRLAALYEREEYRAQAESIFRVCAPRLERTVGGFDRLLCAADFYTNAPVQIAVIGSPGRADTQELVRAVHRQYLPNKVIIHGPDPEPAPAAKDTPPLLVGRGSVNGTATAYVCVNRTCRPPTTDPKELARLLHAR